MPTQLALRVKLFAGLKEKAGRDHLELSVPDGTTVADLKGHVRRAAPELAPYLEATRVAVNLAFAPASQALGANDEVALIPPVSGG
jgi:molybdopterin converting factor subunit 1